MPEASPGGVRAAHAQFKNGAPPSGTISILFSDHHVYSLPDHLRANRVLTAIVRNNTILVPSRSATSAFLGNLSGHQITLAYRGFEYEFGGASALGKNLYVDLG